MSRTSSFGAPTQVRCGAAVSAVDSWIWVTMLCVRVRVEPSAPYVTETNRGCKGRSRSIDRHSVCSIASSFGGKNSKETVGRTRCLATALPIRSFSCSIDMVAPWSVPLFIHSCGGEGSGCSNRARHALADCDYQVRSLGVDRVDASTREAAANEPLAQHVDGIRMNRLMKCIEVFDEDEPSFGFQRTRDFRERHERSVRGREQPIQRHGVKRRLRERQVVHVALLELAMTEPGAVNVRARKPQRIGRDVDADRARRTRRK